MTAPVPVARVAAELGEGPVWDAPRSCLWFVDIKRYRLYQFEPESKALRWWPTPGQIGWVLPSDADVLVVGIQGGLYLFDISSGKFSLHLAVESEAPGNRLNDATTDPQGAIWFGSMDDSEVRDTGRIYRHAAGVARDSGLSPVSITNGPAICPDGKTLYHTDTLGRRIFASTLKAGVPCDTRVFASIEDGAGFPDGPTVDSEGCVWTGLFAGWALRRYAPDGKLVGTVGFPVANVTKMAFGGRDLKTVYVTTARKGLTATELAAQPNAGDLFSFTADVAGLPTVPARMSTP